MSTYNVVIKRVEDVKFASVRGFVPTPPEQRPLWGELEEYLNRMRVKPSGACFALYHDGEAGERGWDIEVCEPVDVDVKETERVKVRAISAVESAACTIHNGPFSTLSEAYNAIGKWITDNGYQIVGPCREIYLHTAGDGNQNDPNSVTEIQFPVKRV